MRPHSGADGASCPQRSRMETRSTEILADLDFNLSVERTQTAVEKGGTKQRLEAFLQRMASFQFSTWSRKESKLSPSICALYGWRNIDKELLKCEYCGAMLMVKVDAKANAQTAQRLADVYFEKVAISGHRGTCSARSNPCPLSWAFPVVNDVIEERNRFAEEWSALAEIGTVLPQVKGKVVDELLVSADVATAQLDSVIDVLKPRRRSAQLLASIKDMRVVYVAAILVLCGWRRAKSGSTTIECEACRRTVGLWNFPSVAPSNMSELGPSGIKSVQLSGSASPSMTRLLLGRAVSNRSSSGKFERRLSGFAAGVFGKRRLSDAMELPPASPPPTLTRMGSFGGFGSIDGVALRGDESRTPTKRRLMERAGSRNSKRPALQVSRIESISHGDDNSSGGGSSVDGKCRSFDVMGQKRRWCPYLTGIPQIKGSTITIDVDGPPLWKQRMNKLIGDTTNGGRPLTKTNARNVQSALAYIKETLSLVD